jgi:subtilisin-like proprotein convertase family protein
MVTIRKLRIGLALLAAVVLTASSQAATTFTWSGTQVIPDNDASGVAYTFSVSEPGLVVGGVSVALTTSGGWNGDLYAYLIHGDGFAVLLNRPGLSSGDPLGYADSGLNVTLASGAGSDIHFYRTLSGPWAADGRMIDPASEPRMFDTVPRNYTLDVFSGMDPNGNWTFFIADCSGGNVSTLTGLSVTVQTVPEPGSLALLVTGALTLGGMGLRGRRRGRKE